MSRTTTRQPVSAEMLVKTLAEHETKKAVQELGRKDPQFLEQHGINPDTFAIELLKRNTERMQAIVQERGVGALDNKVERAIMYGLDKEVGEKLRACLYESKK